MNVPHFSVILPLRDVAPWLPACLASLRAQTWADWEGLCVDDGSTDGTGDLLTEAVRGEARLCAFFQPPTGVSRARNRALVRACGGAVAFLDGDDTVQAWWLAEAHRLLQASQADLVRFGHRRLLPDADAPPSLPPPPHEAPLAVWEGPAAREREARTILRQSACWLVALRTSLARKATFCETLRVSEDALYLLCLTPHLRRLCVSAATPYDYRVRAGSAITGRWPVETPLAVLVKVGTLLREHTPIAPMALTRFAFTVVQMWADRRLPAERGRFDKVRTAFAALFRPNEGKDGLRLSHLQAHWRLAVRCYLLGFGVWGIRFVSWMAQRYGAMRARVRRG